MWKTKEIEKEYLKNYYQINKEKIQERTRQRYLKNKKEINEKDRAYRTSLHGKTTKLAKKFNISYEEASELLKIKNCQICEDSFAIATDHDHVTGKVRGRLCYRCNRAMGAFKDSINILEKAIEYLKRSNYNQKGKETNV